jgi:hypothetical protein
MFQPPTLKVFRVNLKPLIPPDQADRVKPERVLRTLKQQILKHLKDNIFQETFSGRAKKALSEGIGARLGPRSVTVEAKHPAFRPLIEGQKKGQMRWLTKARAPIPIVTDDGELIFRSATPKSMADGKWVHPGRQKTRVIERARDEARKVTREKVKEMILENLKSGLRGR